MHILSILLIVYLLGIIPMMYAAKTQAGPGDTFFQQWPLGIVWPVFALALIVMKIFGGEPM